VKLLLVVAATKVVPLYISYDTAPVTASQDKLAAVAVMLLATTLEAQPKEFYSRKIALLIAP
jgi:hypothetical protein